ncbi:MAG: hypothetical protein P8J89_08675, partial [Phycisphaerales bacterium]|nr:hypothetical protein [Phycisphaerales bacterium]
MKEVVRQLDNTITRARRLLVARRVTTTLALLLLSILLLVLIDWFMRLGFEIRLITFIGLCTGTLLLVVL